MRWIKPKLFAVNPPSVHPMHKDGKLVGLQIWQAYGCLFRLEELGLGADGCFVNGKWCLIRTDEDCDGFVVVFPEFSQLRMQDMTT